MNKAPRYYASKNDALVPVVIDSTGVERPEEFPGETLWDARRWAAHLNGAHVRRNAKCELCK